MAGPVAVALVVPVILVALGLWLVMIFYADSHPGVSSTSGSKPGVHNLAARHPVGEDAGEVSSSQPVSHEAPVAGRRAA